MSTPLKKPALLAPGKIFEDIQLLACDVDGVLTDGGLYYGDNGERQKKFNVLDGQGLKQLQKMGVHVCIISQSVNPSISARAADLKIDHCFTGIENKLTTIQSLVSEIGISLAQVVHIADDINDISLLEAVGVAVTVPNAVAQVMAISDFITLRAGGTGAVRELCDVIISSKSNNG